MNKALKELLTTLGNMDEGFIRFLKDHLMKLYETYRMEKVEALNGQLQWHTGLPNAKEGVDYSETFSLPQPADGEMETRLEGVSGLTPEKHGLTLTPDPDGKSFAITGTPSLEAFRQDGGTPEPTFELTIRYRFEGEGIEMAQDRPVLERRMPFVINPDPRKLWRSLPVDWERMPEPKYVNEDCQTQYVYGEATDGGTPQTDIVAASRRGRSHAQEGKPRDDHFRVEHMEDGWYIMAVADGAGSATFSRRGAQIACQESVDYLHKQLSQPQDFEEAIARYARRQHPEDEDGRQQEAAARKEVGDCIYKIVGQAAFKAHKAIHAEAERQQQPARHYATTLLLAICRRFGCGWFVATFWVGDGAIGLYDRPGHTVRLLGTPDEGEYAGLTRFLTMPEIFQDSTAIYRRLRFCIVPRFTALMLMTDGVSDPKFETDANLNAPGRWDDLWNDLLRGGVEQDKGSEQAKEQLLQWLDFWAPGHHDDRTLAILYGAEAGAAPQQEENHEETRTEEPALPAEEVVQDNVREGEEGNKEPPLPKFNTTPWPE